MSKKEYSKFTPGNDESKDSAGFGNYNGSGHDFNIKGKVTLVGESCYQDFGAGSGSYGNFSQKDSSIKYLDKRNKKGMQVNQYSGLDFTKEYIGGGVTAYDSRPIPETYTPATSNGMVDPDAVEYKTTKKSRNS